ncbi:MAG: Stealth CR1 domain-containing protein [Alphaproteobacteria bacterium]|nr:Stealth CR1 domain-containing protein [Alphaproteobacteria bacterium]
MRKIDLVYMWVDGNDEAWRQEKTKYMAIEKGTENLHANAKSEARWRDNDELKYALRSAEKFVPWINHIYLVTGFNQIPKWLNTKHPKLTVVPHSAIMPQSALPTFNSTSIEMCLANIPGLSECFLLSNDDMFFNRPLTPDFFFDSNGRALLRYNKRHTKIKNIGFDIENKCDEYSQIILLSQYKISNIFNKNMYKYKHSHGIDPYNKSNIKKCLHHPLLEAEISNLTNYKFRHGCQIHRLIFDLYGIIHGTTIPIRCRTIKQTKCKFWDKIYNTLYKQSIKNSPCYCLDAETQNLYQCSQPIVCINDTPGTTDEMRKHNTKWLNWKFPNKSSFEI